MTPSSIPKLAPPAINRHRALSSRPNALHTLLKVACAFSIVLAGGCDPETGTEAGERDGIVARAWLDDPDSTMSPEAALGRVWTPFNGTLARGHVRSTTWLRLRIDPAAAGTPAIAADQHLVLVIMPGHFDEVAVYRTDRLSEPPVLVGDTHPVPAGQALLSHSVIFVPDA